MTATYITTTIPYVNARPHIGLGRELAPFVPDAATRITRQCTPRDGRLPAPSPVFRRLAPNRLAQAG